MMSEFKVTDKVRLPFNGIGEIVEIVTKRLDYYPYKVKVLQSALDVVGDVNDYNKSQLQHLRYQPKEGEKFVCGVDMANENDTEILTYCIMRVGTSKEPAIIAECKTSYSNRTQIEREKEYLELITELRKYYNLSDHNVFGEKP